MVTDGKNAQSIALVDNALFLLCLDDLKTTDPTRLIQSLLCGDDGRNRWFDKCFQLIIDGNGQVDFLYYSDLCKRIIFRLRLTLSILGVMVLQYSD
jgi:hypothetical protein